jgi:hypothetical protein
MIEEAKKDFEELAIIAKEKAKEVDINRMEKFRLAYKQVKFYQKWKKKFEQKQTQKYL